MVKNFMKTGRLEEAPEDPFAKETPPKLFRLITKKPVTASDAELKLNGRSRSAKLRVAEKQA
jgi:16S rRNA (cytosine1402-N4)-methyltransferase